MFEFTALLQFSIASFIYHWEWPCDYEKAIALKAKANAEKSQSQDHEIWF